MIFAMVVLAEALYITKLAVLQYNQQQIQVLQVHGNAGGDGGNRGIGGGGGAGGAGSNGGPGNPSFMVEMEELVFKFHRHSEIQILK